MSKYTYPDDKLPTPQNVKLLAMVGEEKEVLEVGCALGYQSRSLAEIQRCTVTGIEIDGNAAKHAERYCSKVIVGDIESLDLDDKIGAKQFDVITFADVLEHLKNPAQTLVRVGKFLKPGGYVLASIPNIVHASVIFEMAQGRFEYNNVGLLDNTHIRFFTRQTIYSTFEAAGYCITALDRNKVALHETEFKTRRLTLDDETFINYISSRNPEFLTYQFIVKAVPLNDGQSFQGELITAQDALRVANLSIEQQKQRIHKLESDLQWIDRNPIYQILSKAKKLIGRN